MKIVFLQAPLLEAPVISQFLGGELLPGVTVPSYIFFPQNVPSFVRNITRFWDKIISDWWNYEETEEEFKRPEIFFILRPLSYIPRSSSHRNFHKFSPFLKKISNTLTTSRHLPSISKQSQDSHKISKSSSVIVGPRKFMRFRGM